MRHTSGCQVRPPIKATIIFSSESTAATPLGLRPAATQVAQQRKGTEEETSPLRPTDTRAKKKERALSPTETQACDHATHVRFGGMTLLSVCLLDARRSRALRLRVLPAVATAVLTLAISADVAEGAITERAAFGVVRTTDGLVGRCTLTLAASRR